MTKERFYNIDFLRFTGIICIVIFHIFVCEMRNIPAMKSFLNSVAHGGFWVDFFFILSGFFLFYTTNFKMEFLTFFKKRIIRLLPLIWACLGLYFILSKFGLLGFKKYINIYTLLLLNNVGITAKQSMGNLHPAWFVSALFWTSMFYYYLKQLITEKWFNFVCVLLIFFSYTYTVNSSVHAPTVFENFICAGILRGLGGIGLGYIIYLFFRTNKYICTNIYQKLLITFAEGYLLCFLIQNTIFHHINFNNYTFFVLCFSGLIYLFLIKQGYISQILNNKFSTFLGKYSYSIFVVHIIILDLLKRNFWQNNLQFLSDHIFLNVIMATLLAIIAGIIMHHFVEEPAYKYFSSKWLPNDNKIKLAEKTAPDAGGGGYNSFNGQIFANYKYIY